MDNISWANTVKRNFDEAAKNYLEYCSIQKYFSKKFILIIDGLKVPDGNWFDLGSGSGLLADEIEKNFLNKKVSRVDFSKNMLISNKAGSKTILCDLNKGLHPYIKNSSLFVSNFCIHWLNDPQKNLEEWFQKLNHGGKLIISYPTNNCFPEWKTTCKNYDIEYTGLVFPKEKNMIKNFSSEEIISTKNFIYIENFSNIYRLFRSMINVGAQSSQRERTSVSKLKKLAKYWPTEKDKSVNLSWEINLLVLQKI